MTNYSLKTNEQLAKIFEERAEWLKDEYLELSKRDSEAALEKASTALLYEEAAKRLRIEPHITFNDAQFDM